MSRENSAGKKPRWFSISLSLGHTEFRISDYASELISREAVNEGSLTDDHCRFHCFDRSVNFRFSPLDGKKLPSYNSVGDIIFGVK